MHAPPPGPDCVRSSRAYPAWPAGDRFPRRGRPMSDASPEGRPGCRRGQARAGRACRWPAGLRMSTINRFFVNNLSSANAIRRPRTRAALYSSSGLLDGYRIAKTKMTREKIIRATAGCLPFDRTSGPAAFHGLVAGRRIRHSPWLKRAGWPQARSPRRTGGAGRPGRRRGACGDLGGRPHAHQAQPERRRRDRGSHALAGNIAGRGAV